MYALDILPPAERELAHLDPPICQRVRKRLKWLAQHFDEIQPEPLTGALAGFFKFRVGDYRVIYRHDRAKRIIVVHHVAHRREVYD